MRRGLFPRTLGYAAPNVAALSPSAAPPLGPVLSMGRSFVVEESYWIETEVRQHVADEFYLLQDVPVVAAETVSLGRSYAVADGAYWLEYTTRQHIGADGFYVLEAVPTIARRQYIATSGAYLSETEPRGYAIGSGVYVAERVERIAERQYAVYSPAYGGLYVSQTQDRQYALQGTYLNEGG